MSPSRNTVAKLIPFLFTLTALCGSTGTFAADKKPAQDAGIDVLQNAVQSIVKPSDFLGINKSIKVALKDACASKTGVKCEAFQKVLQHDDVETAVDPGGTGACGGRSVKWVDSGKLVFSPE